MYRYWENIIAHICNILRPRTIVEIGIYKGKNTKNIADFCMKHSAVLHAIDPDPQIDISEWKSKYGDVLQIHKALSINALGTIPDIDMVLIDGDHNWYTVLHELQILERNAKDSEHFPLVLLHDVQWPYGRRDSYCHPEYIPHAFQQPYAQQGICTPGSTDELCSINKRENNAIYESALRNGVKTAVEDFLRDSPFDLEYREIDGFHGLGIILNRHHMQMLSSWLESFHISSLMQKHVRSIEQERCVYMGTIESLRLQIHTAAQKKASYIELQKEHDSLLLSCSKKDNDITELSLQNQQKETSLKQTCEENIRLQKSLTTLSARAKLLQQSLQNLSQENVDMQNSLTHIHEQNMQLSQSVRDLSLKNSEMHNQIVHILQTKSWRWTSILRKINGSSVVYGIFSALKDLWEDFGEPCPGAVRYIRHHIFGRRWPAHTNQHDIPIAKPTTRNSDAPSLFFSQKQKGDSLTMIKHMPATPKIHIVLWIDVFDEILLRECLNSVTEQTYDEWHVTVADTSGNHQTARIITKEYEQHFPNKFTYVHEEDRDVRTVAFRMARGAYCAMLRCGNILYNDALEKMITAAFKEAESPDMIYSDHTQAFHRGAPQYTAAHKPSWSPELLLSYDYIHSFFLIKQNILLPLLQDNTAKTIAYTYDVLLRLAEMQPHVTHVPKILYREYGNLLENRRVELESIQCLQQSLRRRGIKHATVLRPQSSKRSNALFFHIHYAFSHEYCPKVSIIIPTKDKTDLLRPCLESLRSTTAYPNYEIVVIDNNSSEQATAEYLSSIPEKVLHIPTDTFNFAHINNEAVCQTDGEFVLLLNNDTEPTDPDWLSVMVGTMLLDTNIGVVGARLLYPEGRHAEVQSIGMIVGRHWASLVQMHTKEELGYGCYNQVMRNCSAIGGACLLTRRNLFQDLGGLDAQKFCVDFCDVDYCLRVQQEGYRVVCNPQASFLHYESATRGNNDGLGAHVNRAEIRAFENKWGHMFGHDPYYSPHFSLLHNQDPFTILHD